VSILEEPRNDKVASRSEKLRGKYGGENASLDRNAILMEDRWAGGRFDRELSVNAQKPENRKRKKGANERAAYRPRRWGIPLRETKRKV